MFFCDVDDVKSSILTKIGDLKKKVMKDYDLPVDQVSIGLVSIDDKDFMINIHLMFIEKGNEIGHHYTISTDPMKVIGWFNVKVVNGWCKEWKLCDDIRINSNY